MFEIVFLFSVIFIPIVLFAVTWLLFIRFLISRKLTRLASLLNESAEDDVFTLELPWLSGVPRTKGMLQDVSIDVSLVMKGVKKRKWELQAVFGKAWETRGDWFF